MSMSDPTIQPHDLEFASQVAHQLRAPVAAVKMMLRMLLGDFAGPLTPRQRDLILKANDRCDQALESISRMLTIATAVAGHDGEAEIVDVAALTRNVVNTTQRQASASRISFVSQINDEPALVRIHAHAFQETVLALLDNAFKYTPEEGQVIVRLNASPKTREVTLSVSDSGFGIPEDERERVFQPFVRGTVTRKATHPGTGLGLAFVKAIVQAAGGKASAHQSELGGAMLTLRLPLASTSEAAAKDVIKEDRPMRVVIVGGVAAGPKAAAKIIRLLPDAEVTVVEKGQLLSYAGCGLPYYVSGVIEDPKELMSTPAGVVRDTVFFQQFKSVRVMNQTEAVAIDRENRRLKVCDLVDQHESWLEYDKLVLATGASPIVPPVPNVNLDNIFTLHGVRDAEGLKAVLSTRKARDVVIVGAGLIGVEFTESLVKIGCRVTLVEKRPQILGLLDWKWQNSSNTIWSPTASRSSPTRQFSPSRAKTPCLQSLPIKAPCLPTWSSSPAASAPTSNLPSTPVSRSVPPVESRSIPPCKPPMPTSMRQAIASNPSILLPDNQAMCRSAPPPTSRAVLQR